LVINSLSRVSAFATSLVIMLGEVRGFTLDGARIEA
jgi:hypothetical protein